MIIIRVIAFWFILFGIFPGKVLANPLPDYYAEPGFNSFRAYSANQSIETIDPFSGVLHLVQNDLIIPGNGGLDLVATRTYTTLQGRAGVIGSNYKKWSSPLGLGWDMHFGRVWTSQLSASSQSSCKKSGDANTNPVLELSNGTRKTLYNSSSSEYAFITSDRWIMRCENKSLLVFSPEGVTYKFDYYTQSAFNYGGAGPAYHVTRIKDINGNEIIVEYDEPTAQGIIKRAYFASAPTSGITFTHVKDTSGFYNLKSISANGQEWVYTQEKLMENSKWHVGYYYLVAAKPPVGNSWSYTYYPGTTSGSAGTYSLKNMISPSTVNTTFEYIHVDFLNNAPQLNNIYDTTAVSKKRFSGGGLSAGEWKYTYKPGSSSSDDTTTVVDPEGNKKVYRHFGIRRGNNGSLWKIGTLTRVETYTGSSQLEEAVDYSWTSDTLSSQDVVSLRGLTYRDINVYVPIMSSKKITRDGFLYTTNYSNFEFGFPRSIYEQGTDTRSSSISYVHIQSPATGAWRIGLVDSSSVSSVSGNIDNDYDSKGNLIKNSNYGVVNTYSRCTNGAINVHTNPNGHKTSYTCSGYKNGVPQTEQRGFGTTEGYTISRSVNNNGTVSSETINGKKTSYSWDKLNRITQIATPRSDDANIMISWSSDGRTKTLTRGTYKDTSVYDGYGNIISKDVAGIKTSYRHDRSGRKTFESHLNSSDGKQFTYDGLSRIKSITSPGSAVVAYSYSSNETQIRDENYNTTYYRYKNFGDPDEAYLVKIDQPENSSTSISRNDLGMIQSVSLGSLTRNYSYNSKLQLTSISHPEFGLEKFGRDNIGNMTSYKIGTSDTTSYIYDSLNRLKTINYTHVDTPDVAYTYEAPNYVTQIKKGNDFTWNYKYNDNGLLVEEKLTATKVSSSSIYTLAYTRDSLDNVYRVRYPSGSTYDFTTNALGQISSIRHNTLGSLITQASYWPNANTKSIRYANGIESSFGQNNRYQTTSAVTSNGIYHTSLSYDNVGNLTSLIDNQDSRYSYSSLGYDDLNRLTRINGTTMLTYDSTQNIRSNKLNGFNLTYSYGSNNLLSSVSNSSYKLTYDNRGNVVNNGINKFKYDEADHLRDVLDLNLKMFYDGNGYRALQVKNQANIISVYNTEGLLVYEDNGVDKTKNDFIYINRQLVTKVQH